MSRELAEIRRENDRLRCEVRMAVEDEVRKYVASHRLGLEVSLGCQSQTPLRLNTTGTTKNEDMPRQIRKASREEFDLKRQELVHWESALLEKSRQMEEAVEHFNLKMHKMAT